MTIKISELTPASALQSTDVVPVVQAAGTRKADTNQIRDYVQANMTGFTSTGASVISVNTTSDALRVTQTGTGNAFVVEDEANPDTTPLVIDASGRILQNITIADATLANTQLHTSSSSAIPLGLYGWRSGGTDSIAILGLYASNSGTIGTHGAMVSGRAAGTILFHGSDGTSFVQAGYIRCAIDGTPGTNDMPGRLVFATTADGESTPTERMRIDSSGRVAIGTTTPQQPLTVHNANTIADTIGDTEDLALFWNSQQAVGLRVAALKTSSNSDTDFTAIRLGYARNSTLNTNDVNNARAYIEIGNLGANQSTLSRYIDFGVDATGTALGTSILRILGTNAITHRGTATVIVSAESHISLRSYTVGTLPSAATAGQLIYVSDGTSNKRLAVSDGTNWRFPDGNIVS